MDGFCFVSVAGFQLLTEGSCFSGLRSMAFTEGVLHIAMMLPTLSEFLSPKHYHLIGHSVIKEGSEPGQSAGNVASVTEDLNCNPG